MSKGESLYLDGRTIITPAALDAAYGRGIRVVRGASESNSDCGASGSKKPCLWHRILENDGTYVVQVVNGRATVSQLNPSGAVTFGTDSATEHNL